MSRPFTDQYGTELTIAGETALPGCARIGISERCGAHIPAEDFPEFIAALYAAAGKPEPVTLERPEGIDAALSRPDGTFSAGSYAFAVHDGCIDMTGPVHCMLAEEAEFVAAALGVCAAVVRTAEPDPAEVDELAAVIRAELYPPSESIGLRPGESDRAAARAALRWMRDKQQRGERP